jgi:hypothetical protein
MIMDYVATYNRRKEVAMQQMIQRAVSNAATPFGCCNFFDNCGDGDLMSLYYRGQLKLLDLMNFEPTQDCLVVKEFISYNRPEQSGGTSTVGYLSDPCVAPNSVEYGSCKISIDDFGLFGRTSKERNIQISERYCEQRPRFRLDGTRVDNETEWDMIFTMDAMLDDVRRSLVTGNATTPGQFDGLERWVRTGHPCDGMLDSMVINWNGNPMTGGNGITFNGNPVANTFDIVDVLSAINRRVNQRVGWSPVLRNQRFQPGQKILVMHSDSIECLLNFYTCWSVCRDGQTVDQTQLDSIEAREFRMNLEGGMFGDGEILLNREVIPILAYDWELNKGPTTFDMYFLTLGVGTQRFWEGHMLTAQNAIDNLASESFGVTNPGDFFSTDGGRVLGKFDVTNLCRLVKLWMSLRMFCPAPWAQARIQNVVCRNPLGTLSPDPLDTSFSPLTSFGSAVCP